MYTLPKTPYLRAFFSILLGVVCLIVGMGAYALPGDRDMTFNTGAGVNGVVRSFTLMPDSSIIVGGEFTTYDLNPMKYLGKISAAGVVDPAFSIGTGPDSFVLSTKLLSSGKVLVGGDFVSYNGSPSSGIVMISPNGVKDIGFTIGTGTGNGAFDTNRVYAIAEQPDGKILIAGFFTTYNGVSRGRITRIHPDGTLDTSFNSFIGANNNIYSLSLQVDGKVIITGDFTTYNGIARNRVARINTDGTLDTTFDPGTGASDTVFTHALQSDGKIVIGGNFTSIQGIPQNRIARLTSSGALDTEFMNGAGFDATVRSISMQSNNKIIVGGFFTTYNGQSYNRIVRLNGDGTHDGLFNTGSGVNNNIYTTALLADGSVMIGGLFTAYNGSSSRNIARIDGSTLDGVAPVVQFITPSLQTKQFPQSVLFSVQDPLPNPSGIILTPTVSSSVEGALIPSCSSGFPLIGNNTTLCTVQLSQPGVHNLSITVSDANSNQAMVASMGQTKTYVIDPDIAVVAVVMQKTQSTTPIMDATIRLVNMNGFTTLSFADSTAIHTFDPLLHCFASGTGTAIIFPTHINNITCSGGSITGSGVFSVAVTDKRGTAYPVSQTVVVDPVLVTSVPVGGTTGSSGGGGGSSGVMAVYTAKAAEKSSVIEMTSLSETVSEKPAGEFIITKPIRLGGKNRASDVIWLEWFLKTVEGQNIEIDGIYTSRDKAIVAKWQEKHRKEVLEPWGMKKGNGFVYTSTVKKMKQLLRKNSFAVQGGEGL
jgi:uncharacterized delta-60 repeat protein